jgi:hypothetical protein
MKKGHPLPNDLSNYETLSPEVFDVSGSKYSAGSRLIARGVRLYTYERST